MTKREGMIRNRRGESSRDRRMLRICALVLAALLFLLLGSSDEHDIMKQSLSNDANIYIEKNSNRKLHTEEIIEELRQLRILVYIPTHLSDLHNNALRQIWPGLVAKSPLLQQVDVLFMIPTTKTETLETILKESAIFSTNPKRTIATYVTHDSQKKKKGAKYAITAGYERGYFDDYDWVIRVNPDTLILEDDQLIEAIVDEHAKALIVDCAAGMSDEDNNGEPVVHTDFTAWRPSLAPSDGLPTSDLGAELHMTEILSPIMKSGEYRTLRGNSPAGRFCRVRGKNSPVIHHHGYAQALIECIATADDGISSDQQSKAMKCINTVDRSIAESAEWETLKAYQKKD